MKKTYLYGIAIVGALLWYRNTKAAAKATQNTAPADHAQTLADIIGGKA